MTDLQRLEKAVTDLLGTHECVIIPDLGAFLFRSFPASANVFSREVRPSGQTLFFNPSITTDDGLLINHWRISTGSDYQTAQKSLKELVNHIIEKVSAKRSLALGKLGNFFLHNDGKLLFLPTASLNLSKDAFGLAPLKISKPEVKGATNTEIPLVKTTVHAGGRINFTETESIPEAEVVEMKVHQHRSKGFIWKIAASVCVVSLSAASIYYGKFLNNNKSGVQLASHVPATPATDKDPVASVIKEKNTTAVYLLTAEDMNREMDKIKTGNGNVFICGGSYLSLKLAENECNSWKKAGIPAVIGNKKGSSLVKVVIGRFDSEENASAFLQKMPINAGFHAGLLTAKLQFKN
jgi:cell division septation protein DedD